MASALLPAGFMHEAILLQEKGVQLHGCQHHTMLFAFLTREQALVSETRRKGILS